MAQEKQTGLGDDELFGTPMAEAAFRPLDEVLSGVGAKT